MERGEVRGGSVMCKLRPPILKEAKVEQAKPQERCRRRTPSILWSKILNCFNQADCNF
jgi:hypothetical protein